ncbi:unnamed protein product, partial [Effrenium voratum]
AMISNAFKWGAENGLVYTCPISKGEFVKLDVESLDGSGSILDKPPVSQPLPALPAPEAPKPEPAKLTHGLQAL